MRANLPAEIGTQQMREALAPYGVTLSDEQLARIHVYTNLLLRWNRSVSLTAIANPIEIVGRHFGESIFASKLHAVENCRLADVGTGAGFPGLALKIAQPSIRLTLIESNRKKCAFLSEVLRCLELSDVEIRAERFEEIRPETIEANIITARAVGGFKELIPWSANALVRRGHLILWVGAEDSTKITANPDWTWQPAARIPESQRRFLLIGRTIEKAPSHH
jgi:16S rRNA (guanine527-N7)-methyltransferase